ncbi:hypothetical protein U1839_25950 [Sphingomonas sp. RT2P30]|uniref:hypothetical protein n=1 Tax=Parasphingomonas halimpatiens TaxID=3096162 RepID=UPI002FC7BE8A
MRLRSGNQRHAIIVAAGGGAMREEFGWHHRKARRVADWSPPPPEPRPIGPWRHLPAVAIAAAIFGLVAGAALRDTDQQHRERLTRWTAPQDLQRPR